MKRERGKTTQRKKGYQPGHQCKQPITGSTLMSSSQSPHFHHLSHHQSQVVPDTYQPYTSGLHICGWQVGYWGFSSVREASKRKGETQCNADMRLCQQKVGPSLSRTVCGHHGWSARYVQEDDRCQVEVLISTNRAHAEESMSG